MEPKQFDNVKFEKEKAIARFNRFRRIARLWQILEVLVVFALITWSSVHFPAVFKAAAGFSVQFASYIFNHHVVFLIGNAIIVLLFFLCRQNEAVNPSCNGDFYDDYVKYSQPSVSAEEIFRGEEEKQIIVCPEEEEAKTPRCDDVAAAAIEEATKQIKRFQRTQSEKLKREIAVRPTAELRRSGTVNCRREDFREKTAADIETLSSEEFQRTIDAFINKHWIKREPRQHQFEEFQNYQLVKSS